MKRIISALLLLFFLPYSFSAAQSAQLPQSQFTDIYALIDQLEENQRQQSELIGKLRTANEEDSIKIEKLLEQLRNYEQEIKRRIALSENLGSLITDQAIYSKSLEKKLKFWRITSAILAALSVGLGIAIGVSK